MIKVVYCLTRRKGWTREQFQDYWLNRHADKVKERAGAIGMTRYVQSHSYDSPMNPAMSSERGGLDGYDGIMEGWWESEEKAFATLSTPTGVRAMADLLEDEKHFIDHSRSRIFVTREHVVY